MKQKYYKMVNGVAMECKKNGEIIWVNYDSVDIEPITREFDVTTYPECAECISGYKLNDDLNILRETVNELIEKVNKLTKNANFNR